MTTTLAPLTFADAQELALFLNCLPAARRPWWTDDLGGADEICEIGVWTPVPTDPDHVAGLVGYFLAGPLALGGEWDDYDALNSEDRQVFRFGVDITKSRRDDWVAVLDDPAEGLAAFLRDGSPVRKTDKAGPGTRGTRKWAPLPAGCLLVWR